MLLAAPLIWFSQKPSPIRPAAAAFAASRPQAIRARRRLATGLTARLSMTGGVHPVLSRGATTDD